MTEQAPNTTQQQLDLDIDVARYATRMATPVRYLQTDNGTEFIGSENGAPSLMVEPNGKIIGQITKHGPDNIVDINDHEHRGRVDMRYFVEVNTDPILGDLSRLSVIRWETRGPDHYEHTFKDPDAARRMVSLLAKLVTRQAVA